RTGPTVSGRGTLGAGDDRGGRPGGHGRSLPCPPLRGVRPLPRPLRVPHHGRGNPPGGGTRTMWTAHAPAEALEQYPPTDEQRVGSEAPPEPMLVIAGAGSGKTETMAAKVVYLVANGLVDPGEILGLTFTRKAAAELSERIRQRLRTIAGIDDAIDLT